MKAEELYEKIKDSIKERFEFKYSEGIEESSESMKQDNCIEEAEKIIKKLKMDVDEDTLYETATRGRKTLRPIYLQLANDNLQKKIKEARNKILKEHPISVDVNNLKTTSAYYEAFKKVFRRPEDYGDPEPDENHHLDIGLFIEHEDKLIALGYRKLDDSAKESAGYGIEDGCYIKYEEYEAVCISVECPDTWCDFSFKEEFSVFEILAIELLGLKTDWIKTAVFNG